VLSHDLWTTAFGGDPAVVGRDVLLNRQSFTVVGVADEEMRGFDLEAASYFAPIAAQPLLDPGSNLFDNAQASWLTLVGRRTPGATLDQAQAELRGNAARIDQEQPPRNTTLLTEPGRPAARPGARALFLGVGSVVMAAFGMVLLIACANVANLSLARATGRSGEIAVRLALGASRGRIVQQLLAESALIAVLGGALGSLLALWSFQSLVAFALTALPPDTPELNIDTGPDARVFVYAFGLTLAAGVVFGLLPALRASKRSLHTAMKGANAVGRSADSRLQNILVGVQIAVCFVLMIAASLLVRGLYATHTAEPGFRYDDVAVVSVGFDGYDTARAAVLQRELVQRIGALPGIEGVARVLMPPLSEGTVYGLAGLPGQEPLLPADHNNVSADYFSVVEIPIVRGRAFAAADETDASTAAIVTEATARRLWPERDPIGQTLVVETMPNQRREVEIVGVARDAQIKTIGEIPSSYVYLPAPRTQLGLQLLARTRVGYAAAVDAIRADVATLDPELTVNVVPLEANLELWRGLARVVSTLAAGLGGVALVLAVVGVYGVVAYAVGRRVREIAVRVALGARPANIVALVLKQTMRPVVAGAAIGLLLGLGVSRVFSSVLFGVSPRDPVALLVALLLVVGGAAVAGVVPARRASCADPNSVLHSE
jgi:predicted permease